MIKVLLTSAILSVLSFSDDTKVFICDSENSVAYHRKKDCRGLSACKAEIVEVKKAEAIERKLRLCGWED